MTKLYEQISGAEWDSYCAERGVNEYLSQEIALLHSFSPVSVLELGVGNGRFAKAYLRKHPNTKYIGVDNSQQMLSHAKENLSGLGVSLVQDDMICYMKSLKMSEVDVVVMPLTTLCHLDTGQQKCLYELLKTKARISVISLISLEAEEKIFGTRVSASFSALGHEVKIYRSVPEYRIGAIDIFVFGKLREYVVL